MKRACMLFLVGAIFTFVPFTAPAAELRPITLPRPQISGGRPLMQVLKDRSSSRSFSTEKLSLQTLSNLLWAAFGINRPESGKRTAPSAMNCQDIDIYVATPSGLYLFDARTHALTQVLSEDIRALTGTQPYAREAAINLVYVSDISRFTKVAHENRMIYAAADTGFISQNVYLYCASEGLATVVRASIDKDKLAKVMKLRPDQKIILAQSVGYPSR